LNSILKCNITLNENICSNGYRKYSDAFLITDKEEYVGRIENMLDKINQYLRNKGLPAVKKPIGDIHELFEKSLYSVWHLEDKDQREAIAIEIAQALKPYYGGKKIEDALDEIIEKLNYKEQQAKIAEEKQEKAEELEQLKARMKDPNYVPTFEELMRVKKDKKNK
jgi:hypothetical protein